MGRQSGGGGTCGWDEEDMRSMEEGRRASFRSWQPALALDGTALHAASLQVCLQASPCMSPTQQAPVQLPRPDTQTVSIHRRPETPGLLRALVAWGGNWRGRTPRAATTMYGVSNGRHFKK